MVVFGLLRRSCNTVRCLRTKTSKEEDAAPPWRWVMLGLLSLDICVSYLPYYTFVPIPRQGMQVYGVDEAALNVLCILYALVYVPAAFVTGPIVSTFSCKWTFVLAMALNVAGCSLRCGPTVAVQAMMRWTGSSSASLAPAGGYSAASAGELVQVAPIVTSFWWLMVGQALCAAGQPLLVNSTSEMGAEWFPPKERPTAALVSNLMNFVGSSLSYVLPPLFVNESHESVQEAEQQVAALMRVQLWIAILAFLATLFLYQRAPLARPGGTSTDASSCLTDILCMAKSVDFWIVTFYFSIFMAVMHAFDAVEGSLLEHYGYSASLSAWTAVSCAIASIGSTLLEAQCISSPNQYRSALCVAAGFLALSFLLGFTCLYCRMHAGIFVIAVGILGLATPGWGCSCELSSEVAYPAREATVSSVMEAFGNLSGVFSIILAQRLLDSGMGAGVLMVMGGATVVGASSLGCLGGRLYRTEAEEAEEAHTANAEARQTERSMSSFEVEEAPPDAKEPEPLAMGEGFFLKSNRRRTQLVAVTSVCMFLLLCRVLLFLPQSQLPEDLTTGEGSSTASGPLTTGASDMVLSQPAVGPNTTKLPRLAHPVNYVISCAKGKDSKKFKRFQRHMDGVGLKFEVFPCAAGTQSEVDSAVRDGLLPESAKEATTGYTAQGHRKADLMGLAISHLRLLKAIAGGQAEVANVFEEDEVVFATFRERRDQLLDRLPRDLDLAKLNAKRPAGRRVGFTKATSLWMHGSVFRMTPLSPKLNVGMSNYVVTRKGARKVLKVGRKFDSSGRWESFDQFMLSKIYPETKKRGGFVGFSVHTEVMSVSCQKSKRPSPAQIKFCAGGS